MAKRRTFTVVSASGLNVRESPSLYARILTILDDGEKVKVNPDAEAPDEWCALESGGYVMAKFLK